MALVVGTGLACSSGENPYDGSVEFGGYRTYEECMSRRPNVVRGESVSELNAACGGDGKVREATRATPATTRATTTSRPTPITRPLSTSSTTMSPETQAALDRIAAMDEENARREAESDAARAQRREDSMERSRNERGESGDVYYENCDEAQSAGDAPLHYGEPGYRDELDSDGDGVACEVG